MCIAIAASPFKQVPDDHLRNSADNNPDGFGFTYVREDITGVRKVVIKKSMDFETFLRQYKRAFKNNPESPFLIHCRIATHGTVNKFNCHPFRIDNETTFIHNGIITGVGVDAKMSDTQLFNEKILKKLPEGWRESEGIKMLLEKYLFGSKVITLDINRKVNIYNESSGHWKDGIWYSNYTYSYEKRATYVMTKTTYGKRKDVGKVSYMCDTCQGRFPELDITFFVSKGEPYCFCEGCVTAAYFRGIVNLSDKVNRFRYNAALNQYQYAFGYTTEDDGLGTERFMG